MSYTVLVYFVLTLWVPLQAYPEKGCCGPYHFGLLENMTNTLSSSRKDRSLHWHENSKALKFLGAETGKYFKELGDDLGQLLEDLRKGLGDDLSDNTMEVKGLRQDFIKEIKALRQDFIQEVKELGNRNERNLRREMKDLREGLGEELKNNKQEVKKVGQEINKLDVNLGLQLQDINKELKGLGEEIKKGNQELREERKAQHEAMMMVFSWLLENNVNYSKGKLSGAIAVSPKLEADMPSDEAGRNGGDVPSVDDDATPQLKGGNTSIVNEENTPEDTPKDTPDFHWRHSRNVSDSPDCAHLYQSGIQTSGVYKIKPAEVKEGFDVYCDMEKNAGGWTVFQRRGNFGTPGNYFYKTWNEYKIGFGDLKKEHWLGNDKISALTNQGAYELSIQMLDYENNSMYANYKVFKVEGEEKLYRLHVGRFSGNIKYDSMKRHSRMPFSTHDRDNDPSSFNCAETFAGAWWYKADCFNANLNSKKNRNMRYLTWYITERGYVDLSYVLMKIKPLSF